MLQTRQCRGYKAGGIAPHMAEDSTGPNGFGPGKSQCRKCYQAYYEDWKAQGPRQRRPRRATRFNDLQQSVSAQGGEYVSAEDAEGRSHEYRPNPELLQLWHAVVEGAVKDGHAPATIIFLGPSGSGKTAGAQYLASLVGLPFTKVDAASMTDAMDWFGTREVVNENGASVTRYEASDFVKALTRPGVLLVDEFNRIRDEHRNIVLPLTDGTGRVTNPLTGEVVVKDPRCFIIMSGNRGLQFTGTFAVDPALLTRAYVVDFDYAKHDDEVKIAVEATGVDEESAALIVRFANEARQRSRSNPDLAPISTREVIQTCKLIARGMKADLAVRFAAINAADESRMLLEQVWGGVRKAGDQ